MKYLMLIGLLGLTVGCAKRPKFKADTCFQSGLTILQILEVKETEYYISANAFISQELLIKFDDFEKTIENRGLVPKSCDEFRRDENEEK